LGRRSQRDESLRMGGVSTKNSKVRRAHGASQVKDSCGIGKRNKTYRRVMQFQENKEKALDELYRKRGRRNVKSQEFGTFGGEWGGVG